MQKSKTFAKLNLQEQTEILVLNAPLSFEHEVEMLQGVTVRRKLPASGPIAYALVFVMKKSEVDSVAKSLAPLAKGDTVVWFAYPKGTSKRYTCDFNRDSGWATLGALGFEGVRQVAIDEDWSALRFRRTEFIRSFKRDASNAISRQGENRITNRKPAD